MLGRQLEQHELRRALIERALIERAPIDRELIDRELIGKIPLDRVQRRTSAAARFGWLDVGHGVDRGHGRLAGSDFDGDLFAADLCSGCFCPAHRVGHFRLDPMGWLWLGLLLHLATWNGTEGLTYWPGSSQPIWIYGMTMLLLGLGWVVLRSLEEPKKRPLELAMNYVEPRIAENGSEVDNLNSNTGHSSAG